MIPVSETVEFDRADCVIWPFLSQPELVVSCIPGAAIQPAGGSNYAGTVSIKFGPTTVLFKGQCSITYDHDNKVCTIEGRGIDGRGASRALARGMVRLRPLSASASVLTLQGEYSVSGPLQEFANVGGVHVMRALLQDFARNLASVTAPGEQGAGNSQLEARPIGAFALIWKSIVLACRSWIGAGARRRQ